MIMARFYYLPPHIKIEDGLRWAIDDDVDIMKVPPNTWRNICMYLKNIIKPPRDDYMARLLLEKNSHRWENNLECGFGSWYLDDTITYTTGLFWSISKLIQLSRI